MFIVILSTSPTYRMPKMRGAMNSRMENLEKNVKSLRGVMEERDDSINQQMEDFRAMFSLFMTK